MGTMALEQTQIFKQLGLDMSRLCFAHMDRNPDPWLHRLNRQHRGVCFFRRYQPDNITPEHVRTEAILALCEKGYQNKILIGGDFARKSISAHYGKGGPGMTFILVDWWPRFIKEANEAGFDGEALLHQFFVENLARYFTFG